MGDPLFTPAILGAAVSMFFTEVVNAAKSAYKHKRTCRDLLESVGKLQPTIDKASDDSGIWDEAQCKALKEIRDLLDKARSFANKGVNESKAERWTRALKFWLWRRLPSELLDIVQRIEKEKDYINLSVNFSTHVDVKATRVEVGAIHADVQEIRTYVNTLQKTTMPSYVPKQLPSYILGVDGTFYKFKAWILERHAKNKPSHLGLHGRGGAGKTLLAQMLHNDVNIREKYGDGSILWITVGLDARVSDLYKKMGLFVAGQEFGNTYGTQSLTDQRDYLLNAFAQKKVFLVLDDVWRESEKNHEMIYWLNVSTAPGSVTLITTQITSLLSTVHAEKEDLLALSEEDSWKLFCAQAFNNGLPPSAISEEVAKEVCQVCGGLPLALNVIGSAMLDKVEEAEWRSALYDLKQSKPIADSSVDSVLFGRLRLSYDNLNDDVLKICFLYFAAFPEDFEIPTSTLSDIWIAEGLFGSLDAKDAGNKAREHLGILEKRSLIHWNRKKDYVQVHDSLRHLALYIIGKARHGECAYECFFHSGKKLKSFPLRQSLERTKRMSFMNTSISNWPENFQAPNLQVCLLGGCDGTKESELKCFLLDKPRLKYLDLSRGNWNVESFNFGGLNSLLLLNFSHTSLKELPDSIGELKCLTNLDLSWCSSLKELPDSIGELKCLTNLDLPECSSLKELPDNIGELKCLTNLDLSWCSSLKELPDSIGELKCLTNLDLPECSSLKELPDNIGELKCLTDLNLRNCSSLKELPDSIGELKCLTNLDLSSCSSLKELPDSIGELKCLTDLNLWNCSSLKELPDSIGELKCLTNLDLSECSSLKEIPDSIGELKCLTNLDLSECSSLKELPDSIGELKCLTNLYLSW